MFSLKHLTKKFNRQTLSEVKPAPLSETVDHTLPATASTTTPLASPPPPPSPSPLPPPQASSNSANHTPPSLHPLYHQSQHSTTDNAILAEDHPNHFTTMDHAFSNNSSGTFTDNTNPPDSPSSTQMNMLQSSFSATTMSSASLSPSSSLSSSDSEDNEDEAPPLLRVRAHSHSPRKHLPGGGHFHPHVKMERISSAEKRKYSQYKCSTGSSSPSSSDDEVKEAFEATTSRQCNHSLPTRHAWGSRRASKTTNTTTTSFHISEQPPPLSGWDFNPFEAAGRPLKVVPMGRHNKHKFFAQMSTSFSDRPFLDFNKMQHSKRLVMVRRPMVIRNNSRVHSIQRPSPSNLQVSLDISQHSFQPVLT